MMQKRFMAVAAIAAGLAFTSVSQATRIDEDTLEIGTSATLDFINEYGANVNAEFMMGYYIRNGILLGGKANTYVDGDFIRLGLFGTLEQHLELDQPYVPYFGADLGLVFVNFADDMPERFSPDGTFMIHESRFDDDNTNREAAFVAVLRGGVKYFLTENLALDTSLNIALASSRIFAQKNREPGNVNVSIRMGFRYCL